MSVQLQAAAADNCTLVYSPGLRPAERDMDMHMRLCRDTVVRDSHNALAGKSYEMGEFY